MASATAGSALSSTITSLTPILKERYLSPDLIKDVQVESGPLLAELLERADTKCGGKTIPFPIILASGGGVGSSYNAAFASTNPADSQNFELTRSTTFGVIQLGGEVLIASEGLDNSFIADMVLEFDAKRRRLAQLMATYVYNDGEGVMGQIGSSTSLSAKPAVITLRDPATAVHFQVGDVIQFQATYASAARACTSGTAVSLTNGSSKYTGCVYVTNVALIGANAGQITVDVVPAGASGGGLNALNDISNSTVATTDYLCIVGDAGSPSSSGGTGPAIPQGIWAWAGGQNQSSIDGGSTFFGVTRGTNTFLTVQVFDTTVNGTNAGSIREALTQAVAQLHGVSARPDMIVMHPSAWYNLSLSLQSQGMFPGSRGQGPSDTGSLGFDALELPTEHGLIKVVADPMCVTTLNNTYFPIASGYSGSNIAFVLETDTWEVVAIAEDGQIPFVQKQGTDGNGLLAVIGEDVVFASLKAYWQLGSHAPGHNAIVLLPSA